MEHSFVTLNTNADCHVSKAAMYVMRSTIAAARDMARRAFSQCPTTELLLVNTEPTRNPFCTSTQKIDDAILCALHYFSIESELWEIQDHPLHLDGARSALGVRLQHHLSRFIALSCQGAARNIYNAYEIKRAFGDGTELYHRWRAHYLGALGVVRLASAMSEIGFSPELPPVLLDQCGIDLVARGETVHLSFQVKATVHELNHGFLFLVSSGDTEDHANRRLFGHSKQLAKDTGDVWTPVAASIGLSWRADDAPNLWEKCDSSIAPAFLEALRNASSIASV